MKDKNCPRTGIIYCKDNQKFNFYLDDYTVTFLEPGYSEIQLDGHFLFGQTFGFNSIAIYKGDSMPSFSGVKSLKTNAYLIAVENALGAKWDSFDSIEYTGGVLNSLFICDALKFENMDNGDIIVHRQNTHKRWTFEIEDGCECELIIGSWIRHNSGTTGVSLTNNVVDMQLKFSKPQSLEEAFRYVWKVKSFVKDHRNGNEQLSEKTYSLIFSSIRNWEISASDRIWALYCQYRTEMEILNQTNMPIGDNEISSFVKYRNSITHGSYRVLNQEIAATAYLLQGLVYCCLLTRIGVDRDKVTLLCRNKKILS